MPTTDELVQLSEILTKNKDNIKICIKKNSGMFSRSLLDEMQAVLPSITDVYGAIDSYDGEANINYIIIKPDQIRTMLNHLRKLIKEKATLLEQLGCQALFIGVCKEEGEPLSTVTDPSKIVCGAA